MSALDRQRPLASLSAQRPLSGVKRKFELNFPRQKCVWPLLRYSGPSFHQISSDSNYRFRPMLLKKSVLDQPQNSREFFGPSPRRSLAMLQPLRRSWVDFHMTTTTPSYKEYEKSIRTQIKTRRRQEPTFSTPLADSGPSFRVISSSLNDRFR